MTQLYWHLCFKHTYAISWSNIRKVSKTWKNQNSQTQKTVFRLLLWYPLKRFLNTSNKNIMYSCILHSYFYAWLTLCLLIQIIRWPIHSQKKRSWDFALKYVKTLFIWYENLLLFPYSWPCLKLLAKTLQYFFFEKVNVSV